MADLSSLSIEELLRIAGAGAGAGAGSAAPDLSSLSTDELLRIAGPVEPPATPEEKFIGGISRLVPFNVGDELASGAIASFSPSQSPQSFGGRFLRDKLNIQPTESRKQIYERNLARIRRGAQAFDEENPNLAAVTKLIGTFTAPIPKLMGRVGEAIAKPLGKVGARITSAGVTGGVTSAASAAGAGEGTEERLSAAAEAAPMGAGFGMLFGAPFALSSTGAKRLANSGSAMRRSARGATASTYRGSADQLGFYDIEDGEVVTKAARAIDHLINTGTLGKSVRPSKVAEAVIRRTASLGKELGEELSSGAKIKPSFSRAQAYLRSGSLLPDDRKILARQMQDIAKDIKNVGNGDPRYVEQLREGYSSRWEQGRDDINKFYRAMYLDISDSIKSAIPSTIPIYEELTQLRFMRPVLQRSQSLYDARNIVEGVRQNLRTSGGSFTTPTLIADMIGGPGSASTGLATGVAVAGALTGPGKEAIGKVLQRTTEAGQSRIGDQAAATAGRLAGFVDNVEDRPGRNSVRDSERVPERKTELVPDVFRKRTFEVNDKILDAVKAVESGKLGSDAVSSAGAKGAYQFLDATGKEYAKRLGIEQYNPKDEKQQRRLAKAYLEDLLKMFDGDLELALTAYHTGPGNVRKGKIGRAGAMYAPSVFAKLK